MKYINKCLIYFFVSFIILVATIFYLFKFPDEAIAFNNTTVEGSYKNTISDEYNIEENKTIIPEYIINIIKRHPETYHLMEYYKKFYNDSYFNREIDISDDLETDNVPLFIQWDYRWAFLKYGKETIIATSGCGPTCIAMVYNYFKKDKNINPKTICDFSVSNNYYIDNVGTKSTLIGEGIKKLGLNSKLININLDSMKKSLDEGNILIALVKEGHFTTGGHFIVIRNYDDMNNFYINDPNSIENSKRAWSYSILLNETRNLWAISKI